MPKRIQRSRRRGWRKPPGSVCVSRPSRWGNPFPIDMFGRDEAVRMYRDLITKRLAIFRYGGAVHRFRSGPNDRPPPTVEEIREHLAGKDLVCWCPPGEPCHADVLLEIANQEHADAA